MDVCIILITGIHVLICGSLTVGLHKERCRRFNLLPKTLATLSLMTAYEDIGDETYKLDAQV